MSNSKIGIHSIIPQKVLSFVGQAKLRGFCFPVVKAVDDTGTAIETKKLCPQTITITRFVTAGDASQNVEKWTPEQRVTYAKQQIDIIFNRCKDGSGVDHPEIRANTDYWEIMNEADHKGFYDLYALCLIEVIKEANSRGIKLALPAFNSGTPEWDDMVRFVGTGVLKLMKDSGHILSIHEGTTHVADPVSIGYGDIIPNAPKIAGAGSLCFRYKYLYSLVPPSERPKIIVSEFYAGGGYHITADEVVNRFKWYDQLLQQDNDVLAFLPFTIDPNDGWRNADYTYAYDAIINYMATQTTPAPVPVPPSSSSMLVGLHGRTNGRMQPKDFVTITQAKIEAVKLLSTAAPEDIDTLKSINPNIFIMVRLYIDASNRVISPNLFVSSVKDDLQNFYKKGIRYFEIHNEPNVFAEGYGRSWNSGSEFTTWFNTVVFQIKKLFPDVKLGFPGISPGSAVAGIKADGTQFLNQIEKLAADWIGIHCYWTSDAEMNSISTTAYDIFGLPKYITEFSNPSDVDKTIKGNQYVLFYQKKLAQAAFSFVVSSQTGFENESWRDEQGNLSAIPIIVGERTMIGKTIQTTPQYLNIRTGAGTQFPILGVLGLGSQFTVLEESGNWVRVFSNGWISKTYVRVL